MAIKVSRPVDKYLKCIENPDSTNGENIFGPNELVSFKEQFPCELF
jgi:hypothetical protein